MNNIELEKKVNKISNSLINEKGYIAIVDILLRLEYLTTKDYEDWRFGRIIYLEKACKVNLSKLTYINKLVCKYAKEHQLEKSITIYNKFGKGVKQRLIFSKSRKREIEETYSTHFLDKNKIKELKE